MYKILNKQILATNIKRLDIFAPAIARKVQPGQFVRAAPEEGDETIPLTVVDWDASRGTISLIIQEVGLTTQKLGALAIQDSVFSVLGPLGIPARIDKLVPPRSNTDPVSVLETDSRKVEEKGTVVCIATGIGTAQMLPIARAFKRTGNKVIGIIGARTKKTLLLESQFRICCNSIFITTEDGSYERRGLATDVLNNLMKKQDIHLVYAIGSSEMMSAVSSLTRDHQMATHVQLNPIMVDCMGMCGSCRVNVAGRMVLSCIEGPEFDGHQVDWKDYSIRITASKGHELWQKHSSSFSQHNEEQKTFRKFLSGILKG